MKKTRWIAALIVGCIAIAMSASAFGEERRVKKRPKMRKVGIGTALSAQTGLAPVAIFVPINLAAKFRVEPELGFIVSETNTTDPASGNTTTNTSQQLRFGIGAFYLEKLGETTRLYVGPRITTLLVTNETDPGTGSVEATNTHINLAVCLGAEHFLTMRFSLGAEAQANVTMLGETEVDGNGAGDDGSIISSNTLFFTRFYF